MEVANFLGGAIILVFGLIVRIFKASWLIAGYNTASKEEKAKYNEEKLTRFVGNMLIVSSAILFIGGLLSQSIMYITTTSWLLFVGLIIYMVLYTNSGHFKK